ncbi:hypothetical protein KUTeg_023440 [Tegillarca granosa]|uniref:Cytochrome P450 n=1 Tax=Tegillarca granosa TaxID=220873 RepID=A0ABQ9E7C1_TEGGR|nr:hypothetical protein KUTeg_023440 [Tegillarca granosa]
MEILGIVDCPLWILLLLGIIASVVLFCRHYSMDAISKLVFGLSINTHDDPNNEMARMAHKAWVAGTSANALAFLLYCLATNEKWQQRLTDEIDETFQKKTPSYDVMDLPCLDMIMSETFRLYPPFLRFNRTADSSTCVQGQTIPKGMDVFFPVFSSSNKEKHRYSYIPFGCGKRNCFGMELALLEVKLAAVKILQESHPHLKNLDF